MRVPGELRIRCHENFVCSRDALAPSLPFLAQLCPPHSGVGVGRAFWCALLARLYRARGACAVCLPPGLSVVLSVLRYFAGHGMDGGVADFLSRPRALWAPPCRACGVVAPCTCRVSCGFAVPKILYAPRDALAPSWPFVAQLCPPHSGFGVGGAFWCALLARLYRACGAVAPCPWCLRCVFAPRFVRGALGAALFCLPWYGFCVFPVAYPSLPVLISCSVELPCPARVTRSCCSP